MMKKPQQLANLVDSKAYPLLLFVVSFVFVTLFSRSTSFLYVFEGGDPAIFKQMGLALLRGKTLYIDYFDNKGCILYFIQALGLWLGGDFFILLMQAVSLTVTLVIWDKMLALYRNPKQRLVNLGIALVMVLCFYQDGDLTEEWCLPFASYPIWVYFRSLKSGKAIRAGEMLAIGLCFGIIAFIRVNNAAPFLGFVAYAWILLLIKKDFNTLFKDLACFLSGFVIIAGACVLYFYLKSGWPGVDEMVYASFLSNFEYIGMRGVDYLYLTILYFLFLSLCIVQQVLNSSKDKPVLIPTLMSYFAFLLSFGTRCFTHYLLSLLPLLVVMLMTLPCPQTKKKPVMLVLACLAVFCYLPIPVALSFNDLFLDDKYTKIYNDFHHCLENIPEEERDSIFNYNLHGNGYGMLLHEGLMQSNKVCISYFTVNMPSLWGKIYRQMKAPKWMLVSWDRYFNEEDAYFILDHYDLSCEFDHDRMYLHKPKVGQEFRVYLYRRRD